MSCLSKISLRRVSVVSIVNHFLLSLRFAETKTFDVFSKLFVSLILTGTSTIHLLLVNKGFAGVTCSETSGL